MCNFTLTFEEIRRNSTSSKYTLELKDTLN
jgi:hypothetical protein